MFVCLMAMIFTHRRDGAFMVFLVYCSSCLEDPTPIHEYDSSNLPRGWMMMIMMRF